MKRRLPTLGLAACGLATLLVGCVEAGPPGSDTASVKFALTDFGMSVTVSAHCNRATSFCPKEYIVVLHSGTYAGAVAGSTTLVPRQLVRMTTGGGGLGGGAEFTGLTDGTYCATVTAVGANGGTVIEGCDSVT